MSGINFENSWDEYFQSGNLILDLAQQAQTAEGVSIFHCSYVSKAQYVRGGWVNILSDTFLEDAGSGDRIRLAFATGIPVSPARHYFDRPGQYLSFTLLFPCLPLKWQQFHLIEPAGSGGFCVRGIRRNERGVYRMKLR